MIGRACSALVFAAALLGAVQLHAAPAEPRIALLVGNRSYTEAVGPLTNPPNDIALMKAALERIGFSADNIAIAYDADRVTMLDAFDSFAGNVRRAGTGAISFFYYSGHGASNDQNQNFLIPTDVLDPAASGFWHRSVGLDELINRLKDSAPDAKHFVIFDACRNNLKVGGGKNKKSLAQAKGFAPIREIPGGMLIAFATAQGELASDVGDKAGPYATALAEEIVKPGVEAFSVFRRVQTRLMEKTEQAPWMHTSPMGEVFFLKGEPRLGSEPLAPPAVLNPPLSSEAREWLDVKESESIAALEKFAVRHAASPYAELARERIEKIRARVNVALATPSQSGCEGVDVTFGKGDSQCVKPGGGMGFKDCPLCPEMVVIPRGEYTMGDGDPAAKPEEGPTHKVSLPKHFAVGKFEVTAKEWGACITDGGCTHKPSDPLCKQGDCPVTNVSWSQVMDQYLPWLGKKAGRPYRLLSEAEWEYAARAGSVKRYAFGDDEINLSKYAWYGANAKWTHTVGDRQPNFWGLYDMHGNVAELVDDCWNATYADKPQQLRATGAAWKAGDCRFMISRGGSWNVGAGFVRSTARSKAPADIGGANIGFRVMRALAP